MKGTKKSSSLLVLLNKGLSLAKYQDHIVKVIQSAIWNVLGVLKLMRLLILQHIGKRNSFR